MWRNKCILLIYSCLSYNDGIEAYFSIKKCSNILLFPRKCVLLHSQNIEYASGGRVVAGSNPVTPTGENEGVKRLA